MAEGRRLFRSNDVAKDGESCNSCHADGGGTNAELGTIVHPIRQNDFTGPRDVPSLWGVGDTPPYGWAGQERDARGVRRRHDPVALRGRRAQPAAETAEQVAALVAYLATLTPPASPFDQGTLSPAARRGEDIFQGKGGCIDCHAGPLLTDNGLHDTLVPEVDPERHDPGAARTGPLAGAFNTPHCATCATRRRTCTTARSRRCETSSSSMTSAPPSPRSTSRTTRSADLIAYLRGAFSARRQNRISVRRGCSFAHVVPIFCT